MEKKSENPVNKTCNNKKHPKYKGISCLCLICDPVDCCLPIHLGGGCSICTGPVIECEGFNKCNDQIITPPKSTDEIAKDLVDLLNLVQDPLHAEDPYNLNHHPWKKDGPHPGPSRTGL